MKWANLIGRAENSKESSLHFIEERYGSTICFDIIRWRGALGASDTTRQGATRTGQDRA